MRTTEECYEYVLARCGELTAQRRRKRKIALSAAVPVCGVIIAGSMGLRGAKPEVNITSGYDPAVSSEIRAELSSQNSIDKPVENPPKYDNKLNIGEVEVADFVPDYGICVPCLFEMSRDEILEHFGLSTDFGLSSVVPNLYETAPKNGLNPDSKHGLHRVCYTDKNGNEVWGEVYHIWDNDEFRFENADGSQLARVIFQRKYDDQEVIPEIRSNIYTALEDGSFSTIPFYELPTSNIAGVEMRIAKRSIGGYYAEFSTDELCVGLLTLGISEENTVAILEYLAEYVGAAKSAENNDIQIEGYSVSYPLVMF